MRACVPRTARVFYGFSPDLPPFAGLAPQAQVERLRAWGQTAVFGGHERPDFVEAARSAGLAVYAEFAVFQGERWWQELPASRPITASGEPLQPEGWYHGLNPALPILRQRRLADLERFLSLHDLDGVWLDFIRWPCHWEVRAPHLPLTSFDEATVARFAADCGLALTTAPPRIAARQIMARYGEEWVAWRCGQITSWVAEASAIVRRLRPKALVGLFGVPWLPEEHQGAIERIIGQDYAALSAHVDIFSPMVYQHMCGRPVEWIATVTERLAACTGKPIWPIIQATDMPTALSSDAFRAALHAALSCPATDGLFVYKMDDLVAGPKLAVALQALGC